MLTAIDIKKFDENGFIEIKKLIDLKDLNKIKKKYKKIFDGKYSTEVVPDKIKWVKGRDANDIPRSLCNVWKSEIDIAKIVLSAKIGEAAAKLSRWKSTKLNQDSLIWVPPKAGTVTFHQDNPYQDWHVPGGVITAWIPIEDTSINGATLEYLIGSHKNKVSRKLKKFLLASFKSPSGLRLYSHILDFRLFFPKFNKLSLFFTLSTLSLIGKLGE